MLIDKNIKNSGVTGYSCGIRIQHQTSNFQTILFAQTMSCLQ